MGRGRPNEHWMAFDTRRSYLALSVANRNFISNSGPTNIDIGFKEFAEKEGIAEPHGNTKNPLQPFVKALFKLEVPEIQQGIVEIRILDQTEQPSPAADEIARRFGLQAVHLAPSIGDGRDVARRRVGRLERAARRSGGAGGSERQFEPMAPVAPLTRTSCPACIFTFQI